MAQFIEQIGEKQLQRRKRFLQFLRDLPMPQAVEVAPVRPSRIQRWLAPFREWRKAHRAKQESSNG